MHCVALHCIAPHRLLHMRPRTQVQACSDNHVFNTGKRSEALLPWAGAANARILVRCRSTTQGSTTLRLG
eukprot:4599292-Lingulodinium_polyedra.AAC.1